MREIAISRAEFNKQNEELQKIRTLVEVLMSHNTSLEAKLLNAEEKLIGCIAYFPMSSIPEGWLECYGQPICRDEYIKLYRKIGITFGSGDGLGTFNLPDLRGQFIRGWDHSGTKDEKNRALGSIQSDQIKTHGHNDAGHTHDSKPHTHSFTSDSASSQRIDGALICSIRGQETFMYSSLTSLGSGEYIIGYMNASGGWGHARENHSHSGNTNSVTITIDTAYSNIAEPTPQESHGTETRPTNIALLACIKYA